MCPDTFGTSDPPESTPGPTVLIYRKFILPIRRSYKFMLITCAFSSVE